MIDVNVFLQICAGIVCVGGALGYLIRGVIFIKKPADDVSKKLKAHQEYLDNDKQRLDRLERAIENNSKCLILIIETLHTILEHFEDGNHTKELTAERKKIDAYLLNRIQPLEK